MNIDVKNALDRVLSACEKIKSISTKDKGFRLITEYVVEDIYDFINAISLTGAEERFQYFDVVYLNGAFSDHAFGDNQGGIGIVANENKYHPSISWVTQTSV